MLDKLEWKKEYEVGVPVIDEQHKKLVALAGDLYSAVTGDAEAYKRDLAKILKGLGDYTVYHFSTEEKLMKKYGYPGTETHKLAHRNFIAELNNQVRKLARCSIDDGLQFYEFVCLWLLTHIAKSDKLLADFLVKKAESPEELEKAVAEAAASISKYIGHCKGLTREVKAMAEKVTWKKEYELGVPQIDGQHKKLVELAGDLYDALNGDAEKYKANLEGILKAFEDYTNYHFSTEEALIEGAGYPSLSSHKLAHQNFIMELNNQKRKLAKESSDPIADGFRFYDYVLSWLLTHIAKADKLWADFIAKKEKG